jgi:hypothetical protein
MLKKLTKTAKAVVTDLDIIDIISFLQCDSAPHTGKTAGGVVLFHVVRDRLDVRSMCPVSL